MPLTGAVLALSRLGLLWRLCSSPWGCFISVLDGRSVADPVQHPAQSGTKLSLVYAKTVQTVVY